MRYLCMETTNRLATFSLLLGAGLALAATECKEVIAAAADNNNTFAVVAGGAVYAWGYNQWGELGLGTKDENQLVPVASPTLTSGVTDVSTQNEGSCVVVNGAVKCWGRNAAGQLGNGKTGGYDELINAPVATAISTGATAIASADYFNCALVKGALKCWGEGFSTVPKSIDGAVGITGINGGYGSYGKVCGIMAGAVKCITRERPVTEEGFSSGYVQVATGSRFVCGLNKAGGVKCAGIPQGLGNDSDKASSTPVEPTGLGKGVKAIFARQSYACAIMEDGGVKCWGTTPFGERPRPDDAPGLDSNIKKLALGNNHLCAITTKGGLKCLGGNRYGSLGIGTTEEVAMATDVCIK